MSDSFCVDADEHAGTLPPAASTLTVDVIVLVDCAVPGETAPRSLETMLSPELDGMMLPAIRAGQGHPLPRMLGRARSSATLGRSSATLQLLVAGAVREVRLLMLEASHGMYPTFPVCTC